MINRVYLVVEDWSANYDNGVDINVFKDLEKAREFIKKRIEEETNDNYYDDTTVEEYYYCGYNEGYYAENHLKMYIELKEVK